MEKKFMFIGREKELNRLEEMYRGDKFEFAVIYGRRRVGKTSLIQEFIKNKKSIYYVAIESGEINNLESISQSIDSLVFPERRKAPTFENFTEVLENINSLAKKDRIVFVIDEFPYLAGVSKGISSLLQSFIDQKFKHTQLFLILCGSSMSFMENQVLGYQSPLYGRRTSQFKIKPFDFQETLQWHQGFDIFDKAIVYGITGGIPQYLEKIDDSVSLRENIIRCFLNENAFFFEEPSNLLKQELRDPHVYNSIITAIAKGSSKLNEIATKVNLPTSICSKYLTSLISLALIKKEKPVIGQTRSTIYLLEDNMFRFWYRFVSDNLTRIISGMDKIVYEEDIEPNLANFMGPVFETICQQYLIQQNAMNHLDFSFKEIGRWWGNNPNLRTEQEIDILAYKEDQAIFAECKWTKEAVSSKILTLLMEKAEIFSYRTKYYYLFSKSGFTADCKKVAKKNGKVRLIDFSEMIGGKI
jgi:AAA+ ATPase superfamily predicted ATPase